MRLAGMRATVVVVGPGESVRKCNEFSIGPIDIKYHTLMQLAWFLKKEGQHEK